jgi:hypothetical protein
MWLKRKRRVRMHLISPERAELPSIEGLLVSRRHGEYLLAMPELLVNPEANPARLEAPNAAIPRERVAFYEVL